MVSMSEFLSGFSYRGEPVIQSGPIDPSRKREGLDPIGTFGIGGGVAPATGPTQLAGATNINQTPSLPQMLGLIPGTQPGVQGAALPGAAAVPQYGAQGGNLTLDPNDFVFGGPEIFARLLQSAEMDGGYLSDVSQNAQFAGMTRGLMGLMGAGERDRLRVASAANLNPVFANRLNEQAQYDTLSQLLGMRSQLGGELQELQFGAQRAFANMLAETSAAEKMFKVNTQAALGGAQIGAQGAIAGGKAAGSGAQMGGLLGGLGALAGGLF